MNILNLPNNLNYFSKKNILITGGTGTIGNELTSFLLDTDVSKICIFSRDEFKQHQMKIKFKNHKNYDKLRFFIGDIRDLERLNYALKNTNLVFHTASLKQVDSIEYNPMEAIKTNILGTNNIINACINNNVDQLIGISTDKCCSPVNLYGGTKLIFEKLIINAFEHSGYKLKTCILRYGNVINSRGSVIPIFNKQKNKGFFTVTHKEMTRFTITIQEARNFILNCVILSSGGEIFIPKLPSYSILQLCNIINPKNEIRIIGLRYGEKIDEEMVSVNESNYTFENNKFFIIEPSYGLNKDFIIKNNLKKKDSSFSYNSKDNIFIEDSILLKQINEIDFGNCSTR